MGSSPLARGTLAQVRPIAAAIGLIPARAGNTWHRLHLQRAPTAHPRSRGEHLHLRRNRMTIQGSSPLARGTPFRKLPPERRSGLIPARAGNTFSFYHARIIRGAHPRSRGEHPSRCACRFGATGSSPLARGTRFQHCAAVDSFGLIPARAGNTRVKMDARKFTRAHPRSRGEHN